MRRSMLRAYKTKPVTTLGQSGIPLPGASFARSLTLLSARGIVTS
jgi:hypothetical protein